MKKTLLFILLFFTLSIQAQEFKVFNDAIEIGTNNKLKLYLSSSFKLNNNDCADYNMIAQFDKEKFSFQDSISVFYSDNKIYLKGAYKDDKKNGTFTWYHKNGKIQTIGEYTMNERTGIWQFFYPKGSLYKIVEYKNGQEYLIDFYNQNGDQKVKDGNGYFKDELHLVQSATALNKIEGTVTNGLPEGSWKIQSLGRKNVRFATTEGTQEKTQLVQMTIATELFSDGKLTKGISHTSLPNIGDSFYYNNYLTSFTGKLFIEQLSLSRINRCKNEQSNSPSTNFYNLIKLNFNNSELKNSATNNWFLVSLEIDDDRKIETFDIYSNAPSEITNQFKELIQYTENPKSIIKSTNKNFYFPFVIKDHEIHFPRDKDIELLKP